MFIFTLLRPGQRASDARVRTSSCRGYVVELLSPDDETPRMLESLSGGVVHFRSLDRVREALRRRGVRRATFTQYHACEEVGAFGVSKREERGVPFLTESAA
jgi:hypothetical protein